MEYTVGRIHELAQERASVVRRRRILRVPRQGRCRACGSVVAMDDYPARCACGSIDIECIAGAGLRIKETEVL